MAKNGRKQEPDGLAPVDEIAQTLKISPPRVRQLQASALKKVRRGLAERGYGPEDIADLPGWLIAYWLEDPL